MAPARPAAATLNRPHRPIVSRESLEDSAIESLISIPTIRTTSPGGFTTAPNGLTCSATRRPHLNPEPNRNRQIMTGPQSDALRDASREQAPTRSSISELAASVREDPRSRPTTSGSSLPRRRRRDISKDSERRQLNPFPIGFRCHRCFDKRRKVGDGAVINTADVWRHRHARLNQTRPSCVLDHRNSHHGES